VCVCVCVCVCLCLRACLRFVLASERKFTIICRMIVMVMIMVIIKQKDGEIR